MVFPKSLDFLRAFFLNTLILDFILSTNPVTFSSSMLKDLSEYLLHVS